MKIAIADIPDEGLSVDIKEIFSGEDLHLLSPVVAHLELNRRGKEIIVEGDLKAELGLQCSRCLKDFTRTLDIPVNVVYHSIEEIGSEKHGLKDDEMDMGFYKGEELDLQELLSEQILLNIQMKPLCSERCKGICPQCGADLNTGQCSCEKKEGDSRLAELKKFLEKGKE
jgi:uncharacterized protein